MGRRRRRPDVVFDDSVANPSADIGFHFSTSLPHTVATVSNVTAQKHARVEDETDGEHAAFELPSQLASEELAAIANTLTGEGDDAYHLFIEEDEDVRKKHQRYESSDNPMAPWRRMRHTILDHLFRHDGLGEDVYKPQCSFCEAAYEVGGETRLFRCQECSVFLQCLLCLQDRHKLNPLHVVKEWTGDYWDPVALHRTHLRDVSSKSLRFTYQLGHQGRPCRRPRIVQSLVVVDTNGVFTLDVHFCGCSKSLRYDDIAQLMANGWYPATVLEPSSCATFRVLELYRHLNVTGNVNAHDFVGTLERLVDPTLLSSTPDRYKAFSRMARQYAFLKRVKRSGVGHQATGWNAKEEEGEGRKVGPGTLAVHCWACPRVNFNLPPGWDQYNPDDKFLYSLMLALDANFRLKNRIRANERQDPSLGSGWGCFVDDGPYKDHLREYVAEDDVSTCIAFAALMQKDTRLTTGLRVSGVGGCVCARHGIVQAEGLGDLQKGERYANMDYILMHALGDTRVKDLVFSYDIACQWKQNLRTRVINITAHSTVPPNLGNFDIQFALPVWHAAAHEESCQMENSLSYARGVGRTDGEGIERLWAMLNPIASATKEMGAGNRHDTIEDRIDHICFEKNVSQGDTLTRKLIIAVAERDKQILEFIEVDSGLDPALRKEWRKQIDDWLGDKSKPNPYIIIGGKDAGPSEAQAGMTAAAFIKGLLQLEDLKRRIKNEVRGSSGLTADRSSQIDELRVSLFKKLKVIRQQQDVLMPGVASLQAAEEDRRDSDRVPPAAEDTKLEAGRVNEGCWISKGSYGVLSAATPLSRIRSLLYAKTHLIHHRNANSVGQRATTRSSTLISRVTDQIAREVSKYRQALQALRRLMGPAFAPSLKELQDSDVNVRKPQESDARARLRLGRLGGRTRNEPTAAANATEDEGGAVSWIWSEVRPEDDERGMHDAVRVRWSKTLARRDRWIEEVRLLREEMRRVLRSLWSVQRQWRERIECGRSEEPELMAGLMAYARRQVAVHGWIAERFVNGWTRSGKAAVEAVMREDAEIYRVLLAGEDEVMAGSVDELEATA
ncbi:hypothetical protein C8F01DRAFT_1261266 [Mycena amicta]|nr:hypothetical protein C8F01DRAFT_1261266 [Mycena amicta]